MSLQQKAIKGVLWSTVQNWGGQALLLITFLILARLLGPETFGLVSMANVFIHFVQALVSQGFADALIQRKDLEKEHIDTAFWANLALGFLVFGGFLLSSRAIADSFHQAQLAPIIQCLSISVVINSFNATQQAILKRNFNFKSLAVRQLLGQIVGCFISVVMAFQGFGVWSLVSQQLISSLVGTVLLWHLSDWRPGFQFSLKRFWELFHFGIHVTGISVMTFLNLRGDDLLIGYFLGPVALGYYTVAYKLLVTLTQLLVDTTRQVVLPTFAKLQDDIGKMRNAFYTATELVSFVAIPAFTGMAILAPNLVFGLFGEQWAASIPVMRLLAFVGLINTAFSFSGAISMAMGKPGWNLSVLLVETVVKLLAFLIAAPLGINAVAWGLLLATLSITPLRLWLVHRFIYINVFSYFKQFTVPVSGSLIMVASILAGKYLWGGADSSPLVLGIYVAIGAMSYGLSLMILAPQFVQKIVGLAQEIVRSKSSKSVAIASINQPHSSKNE